MPSRRQEKVARVIREAAGAGHIPAIPIVLLLDRAADAFLAGRSGAQAWLRKPIDAFDLRAVLDRLAPVAMEVESGE